MENLLIPSNITFGLGMIGIIFGIYKMFHDPQVALDKQLYLDKQQADSDVKLLNLQVTNDREVSNQKFTEMGTRMDAALSLAQNHTHTVDVKVTDLTIVVNTMNVQITKELTRLATIIEERFPKP